MRATYSTKVALQDSSALLSELKMVLTVIETHDVSTNEGKMYRVPSQWNTDGYFELSPRKVEAPAVSAALLRNFASGATHIKTLFVCSLLRSAPGALKVVMKSTLRWLVWACRDPGWMVSICSLLCLCRPKK